MATASPTVNDPLEDQFSWRDQFKLSRVLIFSIVFIIVGALILAFTPNQVSGDAVSTLTFGDSLPDIAVPTVGWAVMVALLYVGGGIVGLLPTGLLPIPNLERVKVSWLILNGILIIPTVLVLAAAERNTNMITMLASSFRAATPIVIGAMAGIWCERSGVVNIAIEGMMLTGAGFGFIAYSLIAEAVPGQGGLYLGILAAVLSGGLMALLHAWLSITFKVDQIISGTVINILALGLTSYLRLEILVNADATRETLAPFTVLFKDTPLLGDLFSTLADIPIIGEVFFSGKPIYLSMFFLVLITHLVLFYTRWGLRTRAVGENPHAADTLGINVIRNRYFNVMVGGLIAGFAGAWFSLETTGTFDDGMTNGTGFIALAAVIFGKWTPFGALAGGILFGFASALETRFQILDVPVPSQFVQMTPYIVTIVVLAGLVGRSTSPKALGTPFTKE
ncbi:MAG: ABC transporter permease [Aggregatilineales bacterium]